MYGGHSMKLTTIPTNEYRDLIIGLVVLVLTVLIWAIALAPAAI